MTTNPWSKKSPVWRKLMPGSNSNSSINKWEWVHPIMWCMGSQEPGNSISHTPNCWDILPCRDTRPTATTNNNNLHHSHRHTNLLLSSPWTNPPTNMDIKLAIIMYTQSYPPSTFPHISTPPIVPPSLCSAAYSTILQTFSQPCQGCGAIRTDYVSTNNGCVSISWSVGLFCLTGVLCFWIPLILNECKDIKINCARCGFTKRTLEKECCWIFGLIYSYLPLKFVIEFFKIINQSMKWGLVICYLIIVA